MYQLLDYLPSSQLHCCYINFCIFFEFLHCFFIIRIILVFVFCVFFSKLDNQESFSCPLNLQPNTILYLLNDDGTLVSHGTLDWSVFWQLSLFWQLSSFCFLFWGVSTFYLFFIWQLSSFTFCIPFLLWQLSSLSLVCLLTN